MEEIHPLFRDEIPSTNELRTNDVYSALIEISTEKKVASNVSSSPANETRNDKNVQKSNRISSDSKLIFKSASNNVKGRYQRHLNRINSTRSRIKVEKKKSNHGVKAEFQKSSTSDNEEAREIAEMNLCMSIWSNKQLFS